MKVRELMTSPAYTCRATDSLAAAAKQLWEHDCGFLPVVDGEDRVGAVITDRDICMGTYTRGRPLAELRVADSMSRRLVTCTPDDDVASAVRLMVQHQLHRLPVVDAKGNACGVLSLNDLALAGAQESLRVLVAACRHRTGVPAPAAAAPAPARAVTSRAEASGASAGPRP
jgi:CBS domain-containing protein